MTTPTRIKEWDANNVEQTNARKRAYKNRQRARREAIALAAQTQETESR